jgi:hypothetical protein
VAREVFACPTGERLPRIIAVPGAVPTPLRGYFYYWTPVFLTEDRTFADMTETESVAREELPK